MKVWTFFAIQPSEIKLAMIFPVLAILAMVAGLAGLDVLAVAFAVTPLGAVVVFLFRKIALEVPEEYTLIPAPKNDPQSLQITIDASGTKVWIEVDGRSAGRWNNIRKLHIDDRRLS